MSEASTEAGSTDPADTTVPVTREGTTVPGGATAHRPQLRREGSSTEAQGRRPQGVAALARYVVPP